jgi:hypothetical protein
LASAQFIIASNRAKSKLVGLGRIACHFISFSGTNRPHSRFSNAA